jgi:TRAP-type mannitol/chloroaromatic compound transport system substrate-binding protein
MANDLQSVQYIVYFIILAIGVGVQWGIMSAFKSAIQREVNMLRQETKEEIAELKRRTTTVEEKLPQIAISLGRIESTLQSHMATSDNNFKRVFDRFDSYDESIRHFYKDYDLKRKDNEHN